jgi:hypothetical protein
MEKLNSDEKMSILIKLPPHEIVKVCQTSKEMNRICNDKRYDPLWREKIREDFDFIYRGEGGYDKYRDLKILYTTDFFVVNVFNTEEQFNSYSVLFDNRDKAEAFILSANKNLTYAQIKTSLNFQENLQTDTYIYSIQETNLKKIEKEKLSKLLNEKQLYELEKDKFYSLFKNDEEEEEDIESALDELMLYLINGIDVMHNISETKRIIKTQVKNIGENFPIVEKYKEEVEEYIWKIVRKK